MIRLSIPALLVAISAGSSAVGFPIDAQTPREVRGVWQSSCRAAEVFGLTESSSVAIDDDSARKLTFVSVDGTCTEHVVEVSEYATVDEVTGEGPRGTMHLTTQEITVRPINELGAHLLSFGAWCGIKDWKAREERTVAVNQGRCYERRASAIEFRREDDRLYLGRDHVYTKLGLR